MSEDDQCGQESISSPETFQADLNGLIDWLAERDVERVSSFLSDYLDELAAETDLAPPLAT